MLFIIDVYCYFHILFIVSLFVVLMYYLNTCCSYFCLMFECEWVLAAAFKAISPPWGRITAIYHFLLTICFPSSYLHYFTFSPLKVETLPEALKVTKVGFTNEI